MTSSAAHTAGPFVADHDNTLPNHPNFRVFSKTTQGNVALFYSMADAEAFATAMNSHAELLAIAGKVDRQNPVFVKGKQARQEIEDARAAIAKASGGAT